MVVWDVTKAAASHAALAGVLAGFVLAVLAILLTRPEGSVGGDGGTSGQSDDHGVKDATAQVFKLLILALFLLVVAAVMWGSLAGHPSTEQILDAQMAGPPEPLEAVRLGHFSIATAAVVLLVLGALSFVASMAQMIPLGLPFARADELSRFARNAFVWLGALGFFEAAYFGLATLELAFELPLPASDLTVALGTLAVVLLSHFIVRVKARKTQQLALEIRSGRARAAEGTSVRIVVLTALVSVWGYVIIPVPTWSSPVTGVTALHSVGSVILAAACLLLGAFIFTTVKALELRRQALGAGSGGIERAMHHVAPLPLTSVQPASRNPQALRTVDGTTPPGNSTEVPPTP